MTLTAVSLLILAVILISLLALLGVLVRHIIQTTETSSLRLQDFMERVTTLMTQQTVEAHKTLLNSSKSQLHDLTEATVKPLLMHQEVILNRAIAKDAITVQALDVRNQGELNSQRSEEYISTTDQAEAERYEELVGEDELQQDFADAFPPMTQ